MTELITRNHGNNAFEIIIKTDNKEHYDATQAFARELVDHAKPPTNADRIRAMSDEELTALFADDERACPPSHRHCSKYVNKCDGCWLEWLQQPAEVSNDGRQ